jgi:hypothetical protein
LKSKSNNYNSNIDLESACALPIKPRRLDNYGLTFDTVVWFDISSDL